MNTAPSAAQSPGSTVNSLLASMSALGTTWFIVTAAPSSASVPTPGRLAILTLASVSPVSVSAKRKSAAVKVYAVSWAVVTVLSAAVGAVLVEAVPTVICKTARPGDAVLVNQP